MIRAILAAAITAALTCGAGFASATETGLPGDPKGTAFAKTIGNVTDWILFNSADDGVYYLRPAKGIADIKEGKFWLRYELYEPSLVAGRTVRSSMSFVETRCDTFEYRISETLDYSAQSLLGDVKRTSVATEWKHAPPGTIVSSAMDIVCPATQGNLTPK